MSSIASGQLMLWKQNCMAETAWKPSVYVYYHNHFKSAFYVEIGWMIQQDLMSQRTTT